MQVQKTTWKIQGNNELANWVFTKQKGQIHAALTLPEKHPSTEKNSEILSQLNDTQLRGLAHSCLRFSPGQSVLLASETVTDCIVSFESSPEYITPHIWGIESMSVEEKLHDLQSQVLEHLDWWNNLTAEGVTQAESVFLRRVLRDPLGNTMLAVAAIKGLGKYLPKTQSGGKEPPLDDMEELALLAYKGINRPKKKTGMIKHCTGYHEHTTIQRERWDGKDPDSMQFLAGSPKSVKESYKVRNSQHLEDILKELSQPFGKKFTANQLKLLQFIHQGISANPDLMKQFQDTLPEVLALAILEEPQRTEYFMSPWLTPAMAIRLKLPNTAKTHRCLAETVKQTTMFNRSGKQDFEVPTRMLAEWNIFAGQIPPYPDKSEEKEENYTMCKSLPLELLRQSRDLPKAWIQNSTQLVRIVEEAEKNCTDRNNYWGNNRQNSFFDIILQNPTSEVAKAIISCKEIETRIKRKISAEIAKQI
jgi:hypothetical protein